MGYNRTDLKNFHWKESLQLEWILDLKNNPVTQITKYRDQIVLLSKSVQELDGKDVKESERQYLINLISRKKIAGTVYNEVKKKKDNMSVDGQQLAIHQ